MARKPAHLELAGGRGPRQRIWEFIRRNAVDFTTWDIEKATKVDLYTIRTYLQVLARGGFIEQLGECVAFSDRKHYKLVRDIGSEAPRLDRQGNVVKPTGNEAMWRTMRIMRNFTSAELAIHASTADVQIAKNTAKSYVKALTAAGYLTVIEEGHAFIRGKGARQARYCLLQSKYTGPRPPMIQRTKCIYDPNLAKIVWQEEPDHDAC